MMRLFGFALLVRRGRGLASSSSPGGVARQRRGLASSTSKGSSSSAKQRAPRVWLGDEVEFSDRFELDKAQLHYLTRAMRLKSGDLVRCFGASLGEYTAALVCDSRGSRGALEPVEQQQRQPPASPRRLELIFAPLKRKRNALLIEKSVELGVTALHAVKTEYTEKNALLALGTEEKHASAVEAAEQCERLDVPRLHQAVPLADFRTTLYVTQGSRVVTITIRFDDEYYYYLSAPLEQRKLLCRCRRPVYACVERSNGEAPHLLEALREDEALLKGGLAILVGPEGGFSPRDLLHLDLAIPHARRVTLGPTVLRAETAAIAALAVATAAMPSPST